MSQPALLAVCTLVSSLALAQDSGGTRAAEPAAPGPPGKGDSPPQASRASGPNLEGWTMALGLGYGLGYGDLYVDPQRNSPFPDSPPGQPSNASLRDNLSGHLPISIGLGYRPRPFLSFGLVLGVAPTFLKNCPTTCAGYDNRLGVEARFHIIPDRRLSPWISLGVGYEWLSVRIGDPYYGYSSEDSFTGYDLDLQVGAAVRVTGLLTVGPYVGLRGGMYGHLGHSDNSRGSSPSSEDIPDAKQAAHAWMVFGVRGAFTLAVR